MEVERLNPNSHRVLELRKEHIIINGMQAMKEKCSNYAPETFGLGPHPKRVLSNCGC